MTTPPDDRLDGPVHTWFELTYANYQVLHRTLMQSMPVAWQERMVDCLEELREAYAHIEHPQYKVEAAREATYNELDPDDMARLGVQRSEEAGGDVYFDGGDEHEPYERVMVPIGADPIPHYNRGRTYLPPGEFTPTSALTRWDRNGRPCVDPQCGDSTWDHACPVPPADVIAQTGGQPGG